MFRDTGGLETDTFREVSAESFLSCTGDLARGLGVRIVDDLSDELVDLSATSGAELMSMLCIMFVAFSVSSSDETFDIFRRLVVCCADCGNGWR